MKMLHLPGRTAALLAVTATLAACDAGPAADPAAPTLSDGIGAAPGGVANGPPRGRIVVANRGSGTLSVIDAHTEEVTATIPLPGESPEPMYVVPVAGMNRILVGDRANDRIVAYDAKTFAVEGTVPTSAGIWHMWADPQGKQLWVVSDIADAVTVIDPKRLTVITTIDMPADLVDGCGPHDTILDPAAPYAYVTITCSAGEDYVLKYGTMTFEELDRAVVGEDPHLSLNRQSDLLYVPAQGSGMVNVLDRGTLANVVDLTVPGAHGAGMLRSGQVFYTTNLPGGGTDGLFAIDARTNTVIGATDTPETVPHNIALSPDGSRLFVTHSGANTTVTVYTASRSDPVPVYVRTIQVGANPFGLAWVP